MKKEKHFLEKTLLNNKVTKNHKIALFKISILLCLVFYIAATSISYANLEDDEIID